MDLATAKPRELLAEVLRFVLRLLPNAGLRLVPSGPRLRCGSTDFPATIDFHGSKWNIAGGDIEYQLVASISAKGLKSWRKAQPFMVARSKESADGGLAAKAFADPRRPTEYYSWLIGRDLSAEAERMAAVIEDFVLPWLRLCEDPANFSRLDLIPPFAKNFIELALMQGKRDVARHLASQAIAMMVQEREYRAKERGVPMSPFDRHDLPLADLLRSKHDSRNLQGLIVMHDLGVEWPEHMRFAPG